MQFDLSRRIFAKSAANVAIGTAMGLPMASANAEYNTEKPTVDAPAASVAGNKTSKIRDVTILLFPGVTLLDAVGPYEMLHRVPDLNVTFAAEQTGPIPVDSGITEIGAHKSIYDIDRTDVLLIPGGGIGVRKASDNLKLMSWIKHIDNQSEYTTSVCTGALILARAGLLKGHKATTHWGFKQVLAANGVEYLPERYVKSGKYWTAAGVSAGLDMALKLIADLSGPIAAQIVQLSVEYDPHPPFNSGSERSAPPEVLAALNARIPKPPASSQ